MLKEEDDNADNRGDSPHSWLVGIFNRRLMTPFHLLNTRLPSCFFPKYRACDRNHNNQQWCKNTVIYNAAANRDALSLPIPQMFFDPRLFLSTRLLPQDEDAPLSSS